MKTILIDGSPAAISHTSALLTHLADLFKNRGSETDVITLKSLHLPYNDPEFHDHPWDSPHPEIREFAKKISEADVVVLGTPLYHGSFSGLLKSALDHLTDDAFAGKIVLIVSNASGLRNAIQAAQQLVVVPRTMGGQVYNRLIGTAKADYAEKDGHFVLSAPDMLTRCSEIVAEMAGK